MTDEPLTPRLAAKLTRLFASDDQKFAERLLRSECGPAIPGGHADPAWIERVRAAALKVSGGSLDRLAEATALGQKDWRDLLMAAAFGSLDAHEDWLNESVQS